MKSILILFGLLLSFNVLLSQNKYDFEYEINSSAFGEERKFYVHVHEGYYSNELDSFGVIYILDAQSSSFYNNAKSIIDYLVWGYQITPMIVVGIHSDNRSTEFIPLDNSLPSESDENNGTAHLLREHMEEEIFPLVSEKFRVNDFRAIIGHSRAGAFIANTIFSDEKDLFNAYIAISPGMHYLNNQLLDAAEEEISSGTNFHKFYYCSYGTVGSLEAYFKPQVNYLDSLFNAHPNNTIEWQMKEMEGKSHWGVVAPSIVDGVLKMNRAYEVDQLLIEKFALNEDKSINEQVAEYYNEQKEKLGIVFPMTALNLRYYGNEFSEIGKYNRAIEMYDMSIELDKNQIRSYFGKAGSYEELKDLGNAKSVYEEALKVLELNENDLQEDRLLKLKEQIQENLARIDKEK